MDWILNRCVEFMGTTVGSTRFTDRTYADDGVADCPAKWTEILTTFDTAAATCHVRRRRSIENRSRFTTTLSASGQTFEAVEQFIYLGSITV